MRWILPVLLGVVALVDLAATRSLLAFLEPLELDPVTRGTAFVPGAAVLTSAILVRQGPDQRFLARTIWWAVLVYGAASAVDGPTVYLHWLAVVLLCAGALVVFPAEPADGEFDEDLRIAASVSLVHGFFATAMGWANFAPGSHLWLFNLMGIVAGVASLVAGVGLYRARVWAVPLGLVGAGMVLWLTAGSLALVWSHGLVPFALAALQLLLLTNVGLAALRGEGRPVTSWANWAYRGTLVPLLVVVTLGASAYWLAKGHTLRMPFGPHLGP